jgi:hypothetical protein
MKTTLWTREEILRARSFLEILARDVKHAMDDADRAFREARSLRAALARCGGGTNLRAAVVRAEADLEAARERLEALHREADAMNGEIDLEEERGLRLAGQGDDGRLVYWSLDLDDGAWAAEAVAFAEPMAV